MIILIISIIIIYIVNIFLFYYIFKYNKNIKKLYNDTEITFDKLQTDTINDVSTLTDQFFILKQSLYKNIQDYTTEFNDIYKNFKLQLLTDISTKLQAYSNYVKDISTVYKENIINIENYYKDQNNKFINDILIYKKQLRELYKDNSEITAFTSAVLNQNDSSLEDNYIYILNTIQDIKTKTDDKFKYIDHVFETYNSDIQRLTNYLNDVKLDVLYIKTDINTFKLDSINLHKLDISL